MVAASLRCALCTASATLISGGMTKVPVANFTSTVFTTRPFLSMILSPLMKSIKSWPVLIPLISTLLAFKPMAVVLRHGARRTVNMRSSSRSTSARRSGLDVRRVAGRNSIWLLSSDRVRAMFSLFALSFWQIVLPSFSASVSCSFTGSTRANSTCISASASARTLASSKVTGTSSTTSSSSEVTAAAAGSGTAPVFFLPLPPFFPPFFCLPLPRFFVAAFSLFAFLVGLSSSLLSSSTISFSS
mmetsp:Transcript_46255/g.144671  ORF Transcript_46255/g.144671 Transcript_46255/m.144671 type:complete len:244 (-) Transcript_46255:430-1161(-)